ncbi:MAG: PAS domain S-box protein, partial [Polaromonas sp.]|nr:PAS domain S-box protein [Polaromonas sp.]
MKNFSSLRSILVGLVLAAIAPLFVFALIRLVDNFDRDLAGARQKLELAATAVAHAEDKVADSARQLLVSIASVPKLGDIAGGECADYFRTLRESLPGYTNIGVNSASGITLCHSDSTAVGGYVGDQEYFKAAVANGSFVASSHFIGRINKEPLVAFALPIKDTQGQTTAVAFAALDFSELAKAVGDVKLPPGSHLLIMDRAGMVLDDNLEASAVGKRVANPLIQKAIQAGSKGLLEGPDANGIKQIYVLASTTRASDSAFFIAVGMNFNAMLVPASQQLTLSLIVLLLITGLGCLLAWLVGGRTIVKPLHVALKATQYIQVGQLDEGIPVMGGPDHELTRIADGFKQMAGTLEQGQQEQAKNYRASSNSQRKLLEVQRLGNIGNWEFDFASQRLTWSDEVHALWGVMPGSFDGRFETMLEMIHPLDRASFKRQREEAMRDQLQLDHEFRVVTPQGDVRWLHQTSKTDFNEEGVAVYCAGVVQDITARKQTELALARSTDLLQRTGKMASVGGWEISFAPLTTHWTDEIFLIHDLVPGTRLGALRAIRFFRRDAQPLFLQALRAALAHGRAWDLELPFTTAKGRRIWVRTQGKAVYRDGKFFGLSGVLQDITTQHDALAQLRLLETCVSRLNDIVLITEAEPFDEPVERIVFVNDAFERQTGYSREEVIGKTPSILQGPKTQRSELDRISAELKKWQPVRAELINYTKTGEEFWVELDIVPVAATEGWFSHRVTVLRDITQRKLAEQALRDSDQRYFALFEDAPVPMWVYDAQTYRFLAVNSAATHDYGYSRA